MKFERSQLTGKMKITLTKLFIDPRYELVSMDVERRTSLNWFKQKEVEKKETKTPRYVNYCSIDADKEAHAAYRTSIIRRVSIRWDFVK